MARCSARCAAFLHDFGALLDDARLLSAAALYDELATTWVALADAATALDHAGGLDAVDAIRRLEHEGVDALSSPGRTP